MNISTLTGFCAAQEGLVGEALPLQPGAGVAAAPGFHGSQHHEQVLFNLLSETTLNTLVEAMAGGKDGGHGNTDGGTRRCCWLARLLLGIPALLIGLLPPLFDAGVQQGRHGVA